MRTEKQRAMEWATNLIPGGCALYVVAFNFEPFEFVGLSTVVGFGATLLVIGGQRLAIRTTLHEAAAEAIRQGLGRMSWMALAFVLLVSAINHFTEAIYGKSQGIPVLDAGDTMRCFGNSGVNLIDLITLVFGFCLVVGTFLIPRTVVTVQGLARLIEDFWIPFLLVLTVLVFFAVESHIRHATNIGPDGKPWWVCNEELARLKAAHKVPEDPMPVISDGMFGAAVVGLFLFFWGYFQEHRTLIELWNSRANAPAGKRPGSQPRTSLRMLVLNLIVLPPMIVGVALAGTGVGLADVVVYGIFIYSGFAVWGLATQVVRESSSPSAGIVVLFFQFAYAFLLTALWAAMLLYIRQQLVNTAPFTTALTIALAAILIQVVFGPVFTSVWENTLSDKWLQQSSKYAILAMILSAVIAGTPQTLWKVFWVALFAIISLIVPRLLLRRNLAAYVLIRVKPGFTGEVMQGLQARDVTATTLYGEFDLMAKIEVPGAIAGWPLRRRTSRDDGTELAELALTVNTKIRPINGIVETQTLLDFTRFVPPPEPPPESAPESTSKAAREVAPATDSGATAETRPKSAT